jgi:predicted AAA+ superfamily ATPase
VSAPKVYAFDTGFICYYRGWDKLRRDDMGTLWEHFVLNEILAQTQSRKIYYWRDKQKHEVDFIVTKNQAAPMVIECKWTATDFDSTNVKIFRRHYPKGLNFVVASDVERSYSRSYDDVMVKFIKLEDLIKEVAT